MVEHDQREADPNLLFFGSASEDEEVAASPVGRDPDSHGSRASRRRQRARRRRRRSALTLLLLLVVLVGAGGYGYLQLRDHFQVKDFAGSGTGSVVVQVKDGDNAAQIGQTLVDDGVVASVKAFTNAANADQRSRSIQPGAYQLRKQMSGTAALNLLLAPSARLSKSLTLPEGTILPVAEQKLADALGVPLAQVQQAAAQVSTLGVPTSYRSPSGPPTSVEGFLWPDTYSFDPGTSPQQALSTMISEFAGQDRSLGFAATAQAHGISPYDALIIASIVESEAKFDEDRPKVARVLLNRIANHQRLQVDATSAYAAKLRGLDPTKVQYATIDSPYNSYTHDGLPPTPIDNPGAPSLRAAAAPADGKWLFYVNVDAAGHLGFFDNEKDFEAAVKNCQVNHWGCG